MVLLPTRSMAAWIEPRGSSSTSTARSSTACTSTSWRGGSRSTEVRPLPGARELLTHLTSTGVPWAIATSGYRESAGPTLELLELPEDVPVITRDLVERAKPDPDLFLAAADALGMAAENCVVVGDSVWDLLAARRAGALGVGLLSGGYGREELIYAGAFRVYEDPGDLLAHLDELGVRRPS